MSGWLARTWARFEALTFQPTLAEHEVQELIALSTQLDHINFSIPVRRSVDRRVNLTV